MSLLLIFVFNVYCWRDSVNTYIPIKTFKTYREAKEFTEQKHKEKQDCYIEDYDNRSVENNMKGRF